MQKARERRVRQRLCLSLSDSCGDAANQLDEVDGAAQVVTHRSSISAGSKPRMVHASDQSVESESDEDNDVDEHSADN